MPCDAQDTTDAKRKVVEKTRRHGTKKRTALRDVPEVLSSDSEEGYVCLNANSDASCHPHCCGGGGGEGVKVTQFVCDGRRRQLCIARRQRRKRK